ncbi:phosphatase PAP2 family protein [Alteribacillus sp. HJP-4]|uniref:phosphatase PAP2 family protein n=1 Tax=Alteribacillus sp. HJP-4 TaxID=2775394 RepID=UPI0035CCEDC3
MDLRLFEYINNLAGRYNWLDVVMIFFSSFGYLIGLLAVAALFLTSHKKRAGIGLLAISTAFLLNRITKVIVDRPRPFMEKDVEVTLLIEKSVSPSFPSDQAVIIGAAAVILYQADKRLGIAAFLFAGVAAFSRVFVGHHYPLDAAAGLLFGTAVASMVTSLWKKYKENRTMTLPPTRHFPQ